MILERIQFYVILTISPKMKIRNNLFTFDDLIYRTIFLMLSWVVLIGTMWMESKSEVGNINGELLTVKSQIYFLVENPDHSDFVVLRKMLLDECLQDVVDVTHKRHYFNYRKKQYKQNVRPDSILACDDGFENRVEHRKVEFSEEMVKKEEDMRQKFITQVKEKEQSLREREEQLLTISKQLMKEIEQERLQLEAQERELDAKFASQARPRYCF